MAGDEGGRAAILRSFFTNSFTFKQLFFLERISTGTHYILTALKSQKPNFIRAVCVFVLLSMRVDNVCSVNIRVD